MTSRVDRALPSSAVQLRRHTAGTLATAAGGSLREVMDRLGHSTTVAAVRYEHVMADPDAAIARELARGAASPSLGMEQAGRRTRLLGSPDASASVAGHHDQSDHDLHNADQSLEDDVPGRAIGGQDAGELQDGHWDPEHTG
jgi:hypothetical protein